MFCKMVPEVHSVAVHGGMKKTCCNTLSYNTELLETGPWTLHSKFELWACWPSTPNVAGDYIGGLPRVLPEPYAIL